MPQGCSHMDECNMDLRYYGFISALNYTHTQKKLKAQRTKTFFFTHITPYRLSGTQEDPVAIEAKR